MNDYQYTREHLETLSNAELCFVLRFLGGESPANGRFRTKARGVEKVLERQAQNQRAADECRPLACGPKPLGKRGLRELRQRLDDFALSNKRVRRAIRRRIRRAKRQCAA